MSKLRYFTTKALEDLRLAVPDRLEWYYSPDDSLVTQLPFGTTRESNLPAPDLAGRLIVDEQQPTATDIDNALSVFDAIKDLSSHQASIERMWAYLCHCDCPEYVTKRWLNRHPEDTDEAVRKIYNHFFATGNRAFIRDNGISRLWWLGKIAHDVAPENPREFLEILLHRQDVRSALIERPSVSMNKRVLREIYQVMREHWENGRELFEREVFRKWMIALNRRGGVILLDSLSSNPLRKLLTKEANDVLD